MNSNLFQLNIPKDFIMEFIYQYFISSQKNKNEYFNIMKGVQIVAN